MPVLVLEEGSPGPRRARLGDYVEAVRVLASLVPPGRVTTYGRIARLLGVSPRLVGRALALNPDPIVYPCHRVVSSNGGLGGYSLGGPRFKARLLGLEGVPVEAGRVADPRAIVDPLPDP
ncbi:MAG: MGMT family protein [Desulfurococcales archaeon]|nr:MGMT family protein [Desulfurococcales archaeon]